MSTVVSTDPISQEPVERRTARPGERLDPAYEWVDDRAGRRLVLRSHSLVRDLLRLGEGTEQLGFDAEQMRSTTIFRYPMLYVEGAQHREQRRLAGRFFTPKVIATQHRSAITDLADSIVSDLERRGGGRLDLAAFALAVRVANRVVGLTESDQDAMARVLEGFFAVPPPASDPWWRRARHIVLGYRTMGRFWWGHVHPAVKARRAQPADDVISALLAQGLRERDILIECVTYASAGMVTTRQLITAAAWHLLQRRELARRIVEGSDRERAAIIAEILRLEPVVSTLKRRTTESIELVTDAAQIEIPAGTAIDLEICAANADQAAVGARPLTLDADRCPASGVARSALAFGAGHHSCPGEYLALEETDLFLQRLLRSSWEIVEEPTVTYNDLVQGYDLAPLTIRLAD